MPGKKAEETLPIVTVLAVKAVAEVIVMCVHAVVVPSVVEGMPLI